MPKQNRVTPEGQIIATTARGHLMGNRGILHNSQQEIVKPFAHKAWIICQLHFKGRRRQIMRPGNYTELFFLDEATALAAGHRPCFECRRQAAQSFRNAWLAGNAHLNVGDSIRAAELDRVLHAERLTEAYYIKNKQKRLFTADFASLPNGTFIQHQGASWLVWHDALFSWTPDGYGSAKLRPKAGLAVVLTPRSTVAALAHGYVPQRHASVGK